MLIISWFGSWSVPLRRNSMHLKYVKSSTRTRTCAVSEKTRNKQSFQTTSDSLRVKLATLNKAGNMRYQRRQGIIQGTFSYWSLLILTAFEVRVSVTCRAASPGRASEHHSVTAGQEIMAIIRTCWKPQRTDGNENRSMAFLYFVSPTSEKKQQNLFIYFESKMVIQSVNIIQD